VKKEKGELLIVTETDNTFSLPCITYVWW